MSGDMRELRHLCDIPSLILANEWELRHLCPWKWPIFCNLLRSGNLPLCLALENGPHQVPRKVAFSWVCQRKLDTGGVRFPGRTQVENLHCAGFPQFFSQHQAAFLGHRWRNFRHFASKGRDALKPNFNKWPEEPFLDGKNGSSGHLLKLGFKASRPLLAQNNFRHLAKIRLGMPT